MGAYGFLRFALPMFPLAAQDAFPVIVGLAVVRYGRSRTDRALAVAILGALGASLLVNDSPGPVAIGGLAAVLALEGGLVHRTLALPVLRRLAPPRAAALPQEP